MTKKKTEPWRIIVALLSIAFIVYTWVKKDIAAIYSAMPREQLLPMLATSTAVTLLKVALLAGGILLIKWLVGKARKK